MPLPTALFREIRFATLVCALLLGPVSAPSQTAAPTIDLSASPRSWIVDAANNESSIVDRNGVYLRYRTHRIDGKGDIVRDVIETPKGAVARLIQRNGRSLTSSEDAAERARLTAALSSPADFAKHHSRDNQDRKLTLDLVKLMPDAMLYSYSVGQPQLPGAVSPQVVLDFKPNPAFHPPNIEAELLTGLEGRIWLDANARMMLRLDARIIKPMNIGWGLLARVTPGGTMQFEQSNAGGIWAYSHLIMRVSARLLMVKTENSNMDVADSNIEKLPAPLSYQDAIHELLNTPLP